MKIAVFVGEFPLVSETFVVNQIVGLIRRGHEVHISARRSRAPAAPIHEAVADWGLIARTHYQPPMPGPRWARIRSAAGRLIRWGPSAPLLALDSLNVLRYGPRALSLSLFHEWLPAPDVDRGPVDYDVIHCHFGPNGQRALMWRSLGLLRGPIVTTFHGTDVNTLPKVYGPDLYRGLFGGGDLFTVGSEFMRERIIRLGAPQARIAKLPMGVDLARFRFLDRIPAAGAPLRLLTVGRLVEVKGIEYALRAVAIVRERYPGLSYEIAGEGPLRGALEGLAARLGLEQSVTFLGAVTHDEVVRLHARAQIFLLPSVLTETGEEENQGLALIEAQASGIPVVATSVGGVPESVCDGVSGLLVREKDPNALASAILRLADNPDSWGSMGRAGRAHAEEHFDLEALNDALVELYRRAGSGR